MLRRIISELLELRPAFADAWLNRGGGLFACWNKLIKRADCFRQAIAVQPNFAEAHLQSGPGLPMKSSTAGMKRCPSITPMHSRTIRNTTMPALIWRPVWRVGKLVKMRKKTHQQLLLLRQPNSSQVLTNLGTVLQEE